MTETAGGPKVRNLGQLVRFAIVGGFNTLLDFALLFLFVYVLALDQYIANILSTGICLVISFFLNRKWTFNSDGHRGRQFALFLIVTLFGLWVVQTFLIWAASTLLRSWFDGPLLLLIAKLAATAGSLTWNYVLYARLVFTRAS